MHRVKASVLLFDAALIGVVGRGFVTALWVVALGHGALVTTSGVAMTPSETNTAAWALYIASQLGAPLLSAIQCVIGVGLRSAARGDALRLFGLYMAAVGTVAFAGDWLGVIVGNYSELAAALNIPSVLVQVAATAPFAVLIVMLWRIGRRLRPAVDAVIVPVLVVAVAVPLVYLPTTLPTIERLWLGQALWAVVITGALVPGPQATDADAPQPLRIPLLAWTFVLLMILIVRLMVQGIPLGTWPRT